MPCQLDPPGLAGKRRPQPVERAVRSARPGSTRAYRPSWCRSPYAPIIRPPRLLKLVARATGIRPHLNRPDNAMHWISLVKSRSRQLDGKRPTRGSGLPGSGLTIFTDNAAQTAICGWPARGSGSRPKRILTISRFHSQGRDGVQRRQYGTLAYKPGVICEAVASCRVPDKPLPIAWVRRCYFRG
jgi:hypothetical protein